MIEQQNRPHRFLRKPFPAHPSRNHGRSPEMGRRVTIGISLAQGTCPEVPQDGDGRDTTERCVRLEPRLISVDCLVGARCQLLDPLPEPTEWTRVTADLSPAPRKRPLKLCPPKWKRVGGSG